MCTAQENQARDRGSEADPYRHLKHYSGDRGLPSSVAERVGLLGGGAAALSRTPAGPWRLVADHGIELEDGCVARLVSQAVLASLEALDAERGS